MHYIGPMENDKEGKRGVAVVLMRVQERDIEGESTFPRDRTGGKFPPDFLRGINFFTGLSWFFFLKLLSFLPAP